MSPFDLLTDEDEFVDERIPVDEETRRARQRASRVKELRASHWHMRVCTRGHVIETHRSTDGDAREVRCPICGQMARMETHETTAQREEDLFHAPLATLARAFDAMQDWAQQRLDASSWTRKAEVIREHAKGRGDLFAHWRPRTQR